MTTGELGATGEETAPTWGEPTKLSGFRNKLGLIRMTRTDNRYTRPNLPAGLNLV